MKEADRNLASAVVVAAWALVGCIIGAAMFGVGDSKPANAAMSARAVAQAGEPNQVKEAALAIERETRCLTDAIYHEARSESEAGQMAVAEVVLNRLASGRYADTICGVVYQGADRVTGCQFSFTCDGSLRAAIEPAAWARAERVAQDAITGHRRNLVGGATHYHADYVDPEWASAYSHTTRIGRHIFYSGEPLKTGS